MKEYDLGLEVDDVVIKVEEVETSSAFFEVAVRLEEIVVAMGNQGQLARRAK